MEKKLILAAGIIGFLYTAAQSGSTKCSNEINTAVWKPFIKHLISGNKKGFRALHSKRITRVLIDDNLLQDYDKYFPLQNQNDTLSANNNNDITRGFELRFDKRICNGSKAWETGYYRGTVTRTGKEKRTYYGRFFVVLEKEEGVWKIIVDADTLKDASPENFNRASPIE
jgi:hypothetical protein